MASPSEIAGHKLAIRLGEEPPDTLVLIDQSASLAAVPIVELRLKPHKLVPSRQRDTVYCPDVHG